MGLSVSSAGSGGPDVTRGNPFGALYLGDKETDGTWRIVIDAFDRIKIEKRINGAYLGSEITRDEIYITRELDLIFGRDGEFMAHGRPLSV